MGSRTSPREVVGTARILVPALALLLAAPALAGGPKGGDPPAGGVTGAGSTSPASSATAAARAKEHFDAAQALYDKGKYDASLVLFREAYDETKSPNAHMMVGMTLLKLGRLAEAYDELVATMREAGARADTEAKYARTRDAAAAEIAPLEAKVAKLVLTFPAASPPAGARVTVNGVTIPAAKLGTPMAYLPGNVEIVVDGLGPSMKRTETLVAGTAKTVVLGPSAPEKSASPVKTSAPVSTGAPVSSAAPSGSASVPVETTGGTVRTVGYGVAAFGVAGMVLFGIGAGMAQSKLDQLKTECGSVRCTDPKYADVVDSGKAMDVMSAIGLGAGIAGLAGGTAMILFGGPKPAQKPPSASIEVGPTGASLKVSGSF